VKILKCRESDTNRKLDVIVVYGICRGPTYAGKYTCDYEHSLTEQREEICKDVLAGSTPCPDQSIPVR
jgi:hypothetical protein